MGSPNRASEESGADQVESTVGAASAVASELALEERLHSLDAIHLASALTLGPGVTFATWDRPLWRAARDRGFAMLPERL